MSKIVRSTPTAEELLQGANHLLYEAQMLSNTAELLEKHPWQSGWQDWSLYMASLESFLVHARSLMDFFCPADGYEASLSRQKDIFAFDYCARWTPDPWESFEDDRNAISREIIHMSYRRPDIGRDWPYRELLDKLFAILERFLDAEPTLHPHLKLQLLGVLGGARISTAYTPVIDGLWEPIDPAVLSGIAPGNAPSTALIDPSLLTEAPE